MRFKLKVYSAAKGVSMLDLSARDAQDALEQALSQGYRVISSRRFGSRFSFATNRSFSVALFSQEVLALTEAGLGLVETIEILASKSRDGETTRVLNVLVRQLQEGLSFSRALEGMPEAFPMMYVATVRTSERTGDLAEALRRFLTYDRQLNAVRTKVVAAAVYPALLMLVGLLVVLFLLGYVVPRFSLVYEDLGRNLPWMSRVLMAWGQFIGKNGWALAVAALAVIGLFSFIFSQQGIRARIVRSMWSLPGLGDRLRLYQLARFTRTLAMLIHGGIPFVTALDMVRGLLRQPAMQQGLISAASAIREGRTVSEAFRAHGLATEVGVRLIGVGERSGELGQALERIATLYDEDISRWIDWFTRLFEPILMIGIGLVIGGIVVLMYLPIFELANSIQ